VGDLVLSFAMSGINNWAHAGGFAGGWIAGTMLQPRDDGREHPAVQVMALALIGVTAVGFALSFMRVTALLLMR
jgi:hypothetical protein